MPSPLSGAAAGLVFVHQIPAPEAVRSTIRSCRTIEQVDHLGQEFQKAAIVAMDFDPVDSSCERPGINGSLKK
jgi:hypothetical protein